MRGMGFLYGNFLLVLRLFPNYFKCLRLKKEEEYLIVIVLFKKSKSLLVKNMRQNINNNVELFND
jgi:tRNA (Thr-GGU) A37 N-methylase